MKKPFNGLISLIVIFFSITDSYAQNIYPVTLDEKVNRSSLIVEGQVIDQVSFWNPDHTMIFTSNTIEVYKIFKGQLKKSLVEVITHGGSVGDISIEASDLLTLSKGETGMFFCRQNLAKLQAPGKTDILMDVYSSAQGFLHYNLAAQTASAPLANYKDISKELYSTIIQKTGRSFENRNTGFDVTRFSAAANKADAPVIAGIAPATVNAGALLDPANNVLTITGTGFGNTPSGTSAVLFDDGNDGTGGAFFVVPFNSPLIISWTDIEIQVRVPTRAGTGTVIVRDDLGVTGNSPSPLNVLYSILTASFSGGTVIRESNLMDDNGSGGYTVLYSTNTAGSGVDFDASPAKATFQRALTTWNELAGLNVIEGGTTTTQTVTGDGINLVVFDNTNAGAGVTPVAAGVLAVCYSFNSMCGTTNAQKTEFDIIVRNAGVSTGTTTFSLGPCPPLSNDFTEIDLESVLLHELGHALNLGHINDDLQGVSLPEINPGKLMNFSILNGVKRNNPDFSALQGAMYAIQPQGNAYGVCGLSSVEMTPLGTVTTSLDECPSSFPVTSTPINTTINFDLVHATSNKFVDPDFNQFNCSGTGTALSNTAYYAFRTGPGGILTLSVSNYNTNPASQAACTMAYAGVPVTGVELAIYNAGSCPVAQSFPAPLACRTISGNGALTDIGGLTANTNYLIMVDGIENTRATFDLTFAGAALPIKISNFSGEIIDNYNLLNWTYESAYDIRNITIEKSSDAVHFEPIGDITNSIREKNGSFRDSRPFTGNNYYRMAITNMNGSIDYSKVVLLKRKDAVLVTVYPNPAREKVNIEISTEKEGRYNLVIHNSIGQIVMSRQLTVNNSRQLVTMQVDKLTPGIYHISMYNEQNEIVKATKLTIE